MLSKPLLKLIELQTGQSINAVTPVNGGSINAVYCLQTPTNKYLIKINSSSAFPNMFQREQEGLQTIANTKTVATPQVLFQDEVGDESFLLLEWIPPGNKTINASQLLGEQLAAMHRHTAGYFGFDTDNYMGSLPQSNTQHLTWNDFFIIERLQPMVNFGRDKGELSAQDIQHFDKLYSKLHELFDEETSALIHGDLWGGNYLISDSGKPYLIDPAVCYGNREFDIAMTTLFGGFTREFYETYHSAYPLQPGWQQRISLRNLYPLLLHVNLFGGNYTSQVRQYLAEYF